VVELVVSLLVTTGMAPVVRAGMLRIGVLDVPNHRSSHTVAVARGGGLACLVGLVATTTLATIRGAEVPWVAVAACVALSLLGFADDQFQLAPLPRLLAQVGAGAAVGWSIGGPGWMVLGTLVTAAVVNVVNFMDGINGITSLTMALWGVVAFLVGRHEQISSLTFLGAVTTGIALGFLPWNAPTARLFLGDSGSYLFGALAASGVLIGLHKGADGALLIAPLSIYLVDAATTMVHRARRGERLLEAHRSHFYQRLTSGPSAFSHQAVAAYAAGLAALVTVALATLPLWAALLVTVGVVAVYLGSPTVARRREAAPHPDREDAA
jgi:UDP-N-acetylmuramyl pentapeptide phosphotransferase/UDP-N-acetylglucosamine-1-phosphate transferase